MSSEDINLPFENSPFIMIGVASFDVKFGIKVVYQWNFKESNLLNNSEITVNDIFKINLCNVHHQSEQYFQDFKISKLEYPKQDIFMFFSVFFVNLIPRSTYFSLGIIMKASEIKNNLYFNSFLNSQVRSLSNILKKCIIESKPYSSITPRIKTFSIDISQLIFVMNKSNLLEKTKLKIDIDETQQLSKNLNQNSTTKNSSKPNLRFLNYNFALVNDVCCDFSEIEFSFLAILLTSHIQTHMTTVVECQNIKFAHCVAMFLDRFLLPGQREMSSLEIHENPIPGLFLQFVHQQKTLKNKSIALINRPTTWACLSDLTVDQIIPTVNQNDISLNNYSTYTNLISVKSPAPWACKTVQIIQQAPVSMQKKICDIQMKDLITSALSYSIIAQSIPQTQAQLLKPWTWPILSDKSTGLLSILGSISLSNEEDSKLIGSITQLLDPESIML